MEAVIFFQYGRSLRRFLHNRRSWVLLFFASVLFVFLWFDIISTSNYSWHGVQLRFDAGGGLPSRKPNIVFILADDYGWNDIGYHGSFIQTPNLDSLASEGVTLENYYVQPICSPSRCQLMTGRYQIHYGMQHSVITSDRPHGLPLDEITLPQKLKENGYSTYIVGKWHLGFYRKEYMPLHRGFERFYGYLTGGEDYWTHRRPNLFAKDPNAFHGLDLRDQDKPVLDQNGTYSTNLFASKAIEIIRNHPQNKPMFLYLPFQAVHSPLEAPRQYIDMYKNVENTLVRTYAAMVTAMDEAVGNVTDALRKTGLWNDTVLIFSTDNGARRNAGSNWPLRGWKSTLWEGGVRGVGFVTSKLLKKAKRKSDALIHISDWFPTLLRISRASKNNTKSLDGFDVWDAISMGSPSPREEILHNIDPLQRRSKSSSSHLWTDDIFDTSTYAAIRSGNWKLLTGYQDLGGWKHRGTSGNHFEEPEDSHDKHLWLFNIRDDPHERTDLSEKYPDMVKVLLKKLASYNKTAVPPFWPSPDSRANPALHGDLFGPWL
ncbi:PREDICTED: arylsulfatase B-like [Branchiostoma belcheri]|uniref:Arylsulfatase B-like n=1 Tax=Branchiostoma belcheri TaxID=7741 RepID=A0A6P4Y8Q6_BRABE|nr:PREDICTED: arylsulfatase B-like [Branchiostoma belcheri]